MLRIFSSMYSTFVASLHSIGTAVTLASVGVYLHHNNLISNEGKRTLALLSQQITFPLYLFTKILYCNQDWSNDPCPDVTASLQDVWMLAFWPLYVVGSGILVGYAVAYLADTPPKQVRAVVAACAFGNSTGLPITLLSVIHSNFPSTSDLGRIDPSLFLSVYLLLYPALQWGIGGWMLAPIEDSIAKEEEVTRQSDEKQSESIRKLSVHRLSSSLRQNVLNNSSTRDLYRRQRRGLSSSDEGLYISEINLCGLHHEAQEKEILKQDSERSFLFAEQKEKCLDESDHESVTAVNRSSSMYGSTIDEKEEIECKEYINSARTGNGSAVAPDIEYTFETETIWENLRNIWDRCFQPPVIGSLLGMIAAITPIRGYFVDLDDRDGTAPFQWMFDGLHSVGQAAVPINMMILGCNLSSSFKSDSLSSMSEGLFPKNTTFGIIVGKMIILPFIGITSAILLKEYFWNIPDDISASFYLVLMIVFLCPTANNVMVMVELSGSKSKEGIARAIAMQYAVAPIMLSVTMTIAIGIASSWS